MQNPFQNPGFSMASLTAAINLLPNRYGRLEALDLFPRPSRCAPARWWWKSATAPSTCCRPCRRVSPATVNARDKRKLRSFVIPHVPLDDVVLPEEVQGVRAFGTETEVETIAGVHGRSTWSRCATSTRSPSSTCASGR